jgi:hypothetical protein
MGGKASLYIVLGFALIFLVVGYNYGNLTTSAVDNNVTYFKETMAHDIAVSGANMAANQVFLDKTWNAGYSNLAFEGGKINVTVTAYDINKVRITSVGKYQNTEKTVNVLLQPSSFAKFAYYMNIFPGNLYFNTGDTITGPFHTQGKLNCMGTPVFQGKVSAKNGLTLKDKYTKPKFYGGYESGVNIPLTWETAIAKTAAQQNGKVFASSTGGTIEVKLTYNTDATVTYSYKDQSGSWTADSTKPLTTLAPNGVIFIDKGNVTVKGTISGNNLLVCDQSSGMGTGNVYIEDDIRYLHNPLTDPNSTDMFGIVSSNNVIIKDNLANRSNVNIDASIFSYKGGVSLANTNMPYSGTLKVFGGIIEYQAQQTGTVNSFGTVTNGYHERVIFDERLMTSSPNYFPTTGTFEIVSWFE